MPSWDEMQDILGNIGNIPPPSSLLGPHSSGGSGGSSIAGDLGIEGGIPTWGEAGSNTLEASDLEAMGLTGMFQNILGDDYAGKLQYFEKYDPIKEEMAGLTRGQSELEAKQGFGQALSGAQAQVGKSIGQAYAQGRAGGGGFGGTSPSVAGAGAQAMRGYGQARAGAQQQMQGQMFDAQMTEAKAIKASQDAYKQQVMQLLSMLQQGPQ